MQLKDTEKRRLMQELTVLEIFCRVHKPSNKVKS